MSVERRREVMSVIGTHQNFPEFVPLVAPVGQTQADLASEYGVDLLAKIKSSGIPTIQFAYTLKDNMGIAYQNSLGTPDYWYSDSLTPLTKVTNSYVPPTGSTNRYMMVANASATPGTNITGPIQLQPAMGLLILGKNIESIQSGTSGTKYVYLGKADGALSVTDMVSQAGLSGKLFMPDNITSYASWAFAATSISGVKFPNNAAFTEVADFLFRQCYNMTEVIVPNTVTTIKSWAFSYNSISKITIGSGVTSLGFASFYSSGPTEVTCLAPTPPDVSAGPYLGTSGVTLKVPTAYLATYQANAFWGTFTTIIGI